MLLQQLQLLHIPACSQGTCSSAASNDSISFYGSPAADMQELRSTCSSSKGNSISLAAHTLHAHWPASSPALLPAHCRQDTVSTFPCSLQQQQHNHPYAPDEDPFFLVRLMFEMPLDPRATDTTLSDLRERWTADVQQLQLYLHQLQASAGFTGPSTAAPRPAVAPAESCSHPAAAAADGGAPVGAATSQSFASSAQEMQWPVQPQQLLLGQQQQQQEEESDPLQGILDLQLRMIGLLWSLSAVDKAPLFFELQLTNWFTGERITEPCFERHRAALQELQLTLPQQQRMAAGWKFFQQLLGPVVAERKQLHAQGLQVEGFSVAALSATSGGASVDTRAAANGCCSVPGVAATVNGAAVAAGSTATCAPGTVTGQHTVFVAHSGHGAWLQAQREQLSRLRLLARKDTLLRGMMAAYMQGCLSLVQQAKLRVAMSPYHANIGILCVVLMEQMQQQQQ